MMVPCEGLGCDTQIEEVVAVMHNNMCKECRPEVDYASVSTGLAMPAELNKADDPPAKKTSRPDRLGKKLRTYSKDEQIAIVRDYDGSESIEAYCRGKGISSSNYYNWRKALKPVDKAPKQAPDKTVEPDELINALLKYHSLPEKVQGVMKKWEAIALTLNTSPFPSPEIVAGEKVLIGGGETAARLAAGLIKLALADFQEAIGVE